MALEIQWSNRADKRFDKIIDYLLEEWGENVTRSFVRRVYDLLDILAEFPEIGTVEDKEKGIRGYVLVKQITLFYRISGDKLILLNFFDTRQGPKKKRF